MKKLPFISAMMLVLASCSTTRVLSEGEMRLEDNSIQMDGASSVSPESLRSYIRQQTESSFLFGWNPSINIYNWGGQADNAFARLFRKIGKAPTVFNPMLVDSSRENIERHLEYLGYYNSKVTARIDTVKRRVKVSYIVHPGKQYKINKINYSIPSDPGFAEEFSADSLNMTIRTGDMLSVSALEQESARGAEHFRQRGYYGFSKNQYFFTADTISQPGKTILDYQIRNYTRNGGETSAQPVIKSRIGEVRISHPKSLKIRPAVLRGLNTIKPGAIYNEQTVSNTYSRLSTIKLINGVSIEMNQVDTGLVDCNITLSQSKIQGFKMNLEGSIHSTGLMGISPQVSYFHKNIFNGGEWLNVNLMGNFQFKWTDRDVHSNEWGISTSLDIPRFVGLPYSRFRGTSMPHTAIKAAYNFQSRPEFTRNLASISFGYSGSILKGHAIYEITPLDLNYVSLSDIGKDFSSTLEKNPFIRYSYQDHFDAGLSGTLYWSTNMDLVPKTPYHYARLSMDLSGSLLSLLKPLMDTNSAGQGLVLGAPFSQYVRGELTLGRTFRFGRNDSNALATRLMAGAGYAYGNSTALPYEKQFYCGGAGSLRGWQARSVGPGFDQLNDSFAIPSQTGDMKFEANIEYRYNIISKLEGAVFVDAGNVWNAMYEDKIDFIGSLAADWGLGLRLNLDFILIRVDAGFKIHDPSLAAGQRWRSPSSWLDNDGYAIHFGVGYPF